MIIAVPVPNMPAPISTYRENTVIAKTTRAMLTRDSRSVAIPPVNRATSVTNRIRLVSTKTSAEVRTAP